MSTPHLFFLKIIVSTNLLFFFTPYRLPFVTFHSDADTMTDPDGSRKLVAQATSSIKSYENCPGSWHILINEPGNEKTLEKTIAFLNRINS